jgi:hypothetical protein
MDTMKRFFLLASLACAFAGNVQADNPQVVVHTTYAEQDARNQAAWEHAHALELNYFPILAEKGLVPHDPNLRTAYNDWLKRNQRNNEETKRILAVDQLSEGDASVLPNTYDDVATIKVYLHNSGQDVSDTEASNVRSYMLTNHIHHVSQLGQ